MSVSNTAIRAGFQFGPQLKYTIIIAAKVQGFRRKAKNKV
jgi:hypothetical protein